MGPIAPAQSDATPGASNVGGNADMQIDRDAQARDEAPREEEVETQNAQFQAVMTDKGTQTNAFAPVAVEV